MHLCRNKKSALVSHEFVRIVLLTFAFLLIIPVIEITKQKAEAKTTESICRGSVALRERSYTELKKGILDFGSVATPLLCRTTDKYMPENEDSTKEMIEREIADSMAKSWETFGEGRIQDVFKGGDQFSKNCFIFYTVSLRETSKFKGEKATITSAEMRQYLFEHPYRAYQEGDFCKVTGGFCDDAENSAGCNDKIDAPSTYLLFDKNNNACKKKNKKGCCYTEYGCWNKGGRCENLNPDSNAYSLYPEWNCPKGMQCYVKKENYYSYGDYIQKYGGPGNIIITTPIIKPGETYAVSFGSPTKQCGWCTTAALYGSAAAAGSAMGAIHGLLLGGGAIVTAVTAVPTLGASLIIGGGVLAAAGGYVATKTITENAEGVTREQIDELLGERGINTIYFTTLNEMQQGNHCSIVEDIRDD